MKTALLVAGAVVLLVAAPAPAKTVTVDITKRGFAPTAVTIAAGDSVTWTNKDTVNHQVVCATCPFTSPALAPGATFTYVFAKIGKFTIADSLSKIKKATVTVKAAPPTVSAALTPSIVTYGQTVTFSGTLSTSQANEKVEILAQACTETTAKVVTTATTANGGAYMYQPQPASATRYQARFKAPGGTISSTTLNVAVRPVVALTRVSLYKFRAQVVAAQSFVGKAVVLQRYVAARHKWLTVKTAFLGTRAAATTPRAGSTVSSVTFKIRLRSGLKVRAILPPLQAAPCYLAARSATIRS